MALIPVEQAEVGMVLAEGVTDLRGRLLIPAGKTLEDRYLSALPMWGVTHIKVEGEAPGCPEEALESPEPWAMAQSAEEMDQLFLHTNRSHPMVKELYRIRMGRRAKEIQKEACHAD